MTSADSRSGLEFLQTVARCQADVPDVRAGIARLPVDASTIEKIGKGSKKINLAQWCTDYQWCTDDRPTHSIILRSSPENAIFSQKPIGPASERYVTYISDCQNKLGVTGVRIHLACMVHVIFSHLKRLV